VKIQSLQAKNFFNQDSKRWSKKSKISNKKLQNIVQHRNNYVFNKLKKIKPNYFLDVGCGSGDLINMSKKYTQNSIGIDFAEKMINIAKKNFLKNKNNNLEFYNKSIFDYKTQKRFNLISANGFIEYLSLSDLSKFIILSKKLLKKNGYLILSSRNRLFNAVSLNQFTLKEIDTNKLKDLVEEIIDLKNLKFEEFKKIKKRKITEIKFKQPKTGINVDVRHQYTPNQLINFLDKYNFKVEEIFPINLHIYGNSILKKNNLYKLNIKKNLKYEIYKSFIPHASTFMVIAKKK
jgi:2-polyprenyl-3-methyl-5-hydroxy-6-metoxy-1,4-benzoquinol methylase